jgi:peptide-methionine (R)-S-oxide reductase
MEAWACAASFPRIAARLPASRRFTPQAQEVTLSQSETNPERDSKIDSEQKVVRSNAEWQTMLTPQQYNVLREKGTERPFTGLLTENHETGNYHCAGCGALLFMSGAKFDSGCGWPSFMIPAGSNSVVEHEDKSHGMRRVEVTCARCGGHLGHVFPDGPGPTGLRYCINSASLSFTREGE